MSNDREFEHKAKMDEIAELIVPAGPPPWLRDLLSDLSFEVWSGHSIETIQPTRAELWERLLTINQSSIELSEALQAPFVLAFLASNSDIPFESRQSEIVDFLSTLIAASKKTIDALQLLTPDGKIRPGAGKPRLPGVLPPKYACAAIIAEIRRFFDGTHPAPTNIRAWNAAEQFWNSWIVPADKLVNNPLAKWQRYFEAIMDPDLESIRKEVRRLLDIHSAADISKNNTAQ
jgi:hypothetical protein